MADVELRAGLMRNRSFLLVLTGMTLSLVGDAFFAIAMPLLVLDGGGSPALLAGLQSIRSVLNIGLAPLAGTVADRSDRRRLMLTADLVRGLVLVGLVAVLVRGGGVLYLALGVTLMELSALFFGPAYVAAQGALVHPDDLPRAISLFQLGQQGVAVIGPALAGVVIAWAGPAGAIGLDAISFFLSAVALAFIGLGWERRRAGGRNPFWVDLREGITLLVQSPVIQRILLLSIGINFAGAAFGVLMPVIAIKTLGLQGRALGLLYAVNPAGMAFGLSILALLGKRVTRRGRVSLWGLVGMGLCNLAMGWVSTPIPYGLLLFGGGLFFGIANGLLFTIYLILIPREQQGRYFGLSGSLGRILMPVGAGLAGWAVGILSPFSVAASMGAVVMALSFWALGRPGLRDVD